jgi:predicted nucleotidyltransferase
MVSFTRRAGSGDHSSRRGYTDRVSLNLTLPPDVQTRLTGLGDAIAACSPDIQFAYLFGSAAAGALTALSDIDVAIHVAPRADGQAVRLAVVRAAARQLATDAVDVVLLNTAPISLSGRVLVSRLVIAERDPYARQAYESLTLRKFHDFRIREHRLLVERSAHG